MMTAGDTVGVFQIESSGFTELVKKLKPDASRTSSRSARSIGPGPLEGGMVDDFVNRKHGRTKVTYPHPALEPILKDTYGVIVYQEQVMQISAALAGYTLGEADLLRRAMGKKKKPRTWPRRRRKFLEGAEKNGRRPEGRRRDLRADGEVRRLRLQQVALGRVRPGHVSDGVSQGALPGRVHGRRC